MYESTLIHTDVYSFAGELKWRENMTRYLCLTRDEIRMNLPLFGVDL